VNDKVETLRLPVKLTDVEVLERSRELGDEVQKFEDAVAVQKSSAKAHKDKVDTHDARIRALALVVRSGEEHRPIECEWRADAGLRTLKLVRRDTYEVVRSRPMTDEELAEAAQGAFPFVDTVRPMKRGAKSEG
jgi:hypothetical protein